MNQDSVKQKVKNSLKKLRAKDRELLEINVNERTISHKLAEYLQNEFPDYSVDCEYNRHVDIKKTLEIPDNHIGWDDTESKTVFPDIIIHKRMSDKDNLLIIEMKKTSNKINRSFDLSKIQAFMTPPYNYKLGLFLEINTAEEKDNCKWFG